MCAHLRWMHVRKCSTFDCWSGLDISLIWTLASKSMRCSRWLDTLSFCRVVVGVREHWCIIAHKWNHRYKYVWHESKSLARNKIWKQKVGSSHVVITWNPNSAWSHSRRSASSFFSWSLGHGRPPGVTKSMNSGFNLQVIMKSNISHTVIVSTSHQSTQEGNQDGWEPWDIA